MEEILHLQEVGKFEVSCSSPFSPLLLNVFQCPVRPDCFFRVMSAKAMTFDGIQY
jgi:hypothetical protein